MPSREASAPCINLSSSEVAAQSTLFCTQGCSGLVLPRHGRFVGLGRSRSRVTCSLHGQQECSIQHSFNAEGVGIVENVVVSNMSNKRASAFLSWADSRMARTLCEAYAGSWVATQRACLRTSNNICLPILRPQSRVKLSIWRILLCVLWCT